MNIEHSSKKQSNQFNKFIFLIFFLKTQFVSSVSKAVAFEHTLMYPSV